MSIAALLPALPVLIATIPALAAPRYLEARVGDLPCAPFNS
jgi:hypothetical protein